MTYKQTTPTPNILFDQHLPNLSESELKVLLVVIRQTYGWMNKKTGKRKVRDRISHSQFIQKTGLSRRIISQAIQSLVRRGLLVISDYEKNILQTPQERKGKLYLYYTPKLYPQPVQRTASGYAIGDIIQRRMCV